MEETKNIKKKPEDKKVSLKQYNEMKENYEKAMATAAYHQNLSKYYQGEYDKMIKFKSQALIENMLPVLDSFEFAFKGNCNSDEARNYRAGFEYLYKMLMKTLEDEGLETVTPKVGDKYDSNVMQIIEVIETEDETKIDTISDVSLNGYKLKERLIRPATVKVYVLKKDELEQEEIKEN